MKIRKIDKYSTEYQKFEDEFNKLFDPRYHLDNYRESPFFAKDSLYFFYETDDGGFVGAANVMFITEKCYEDILSLKIVDDMQLKPQHISAFNLNSINYMYFSSIFIKKEYQGRGYGLKFCHEITLECLSLCQQVKFISIAINESSVRTFKKCGFTIENTLDEDHVIMVR